MKKLHLIIVIGFIWVFLACESSEKKVACVGDSITEGSGIAVQSKSAYPVVLDGLLGDGYEAINFGRSATNMQKTADFPYWICKEFANVFAFKPNVIVIKLGTNDTKPQNWNAENYERDYQAMIDTFRTIPTHPEIYLCTPAPVFKTKWGINDSTVVYGVIPAIQKIAKTNNLPIIDMYNGLQDQGMNFFDSIHPNEAAAKVMAEIIASELKK